MTNQKFPTRIIKVPQPGGKKLYKPQFKWMNSWYSFKPSYPFPYCMLKKFRAATRVLSYNWITTEVLVEKRPLAAEILIDYELEMKDAMQ